MLLALCKLDVVTAKWIRHTDCIPLFLEMLIYKQNTHIFYNSTQWDGNLIIEQKVWAVYSVHWTLIPHEQGQT